MNHAQNPITFKRFLTEPEERALFKTVSLYGGLLARRDHQWMLLLRQTGIRVGTLAGLTVLDARLAITAGRLELRGEICKGGRGYTVQLNKKALRALRGLIRLRVEQGHALINEHPLIMSRQGTGLTIRSFQQRVKKWADLAGLPGDITPHFFRHTMGRRIIERSTAANPQRIAQAVLNHSNIQTTSIYTQPTREDLDQIMQEVA